MKLPSAMSVINAFLPVVVTILIVSTIICGQTSGISTAVIGQNVTSINNASVVNSTIPVGLVQPVVPVVVTNVSTVALASVSSGKFWTNEIHDVREWKPCFSIFNIVSLISLVTVLPVVTIGPHAACYTSRHCLDSGTVCKVANLAQILAHRSESNIIKPNYAYLTAVRESIDLASSDLTQPYEEPEASLVSTTGLCQCDSRRRTVSKQLNVVHSTETTWFTHEQFQPVCYIYYVIRPVYLTLTAKLNWAATIFAVCLHRSAEPRPTPDFAAWFRRKVLQILQ